MLTDPAQLPCYLGLPQWSLKCWQPLPPHCSALQRYAQQYSTVEGNTTFYRDPSVLRVHNWALQVNAAFRFCFKLPQRITHHARPDQQLDQAIAFIRLFDSMRDRLGPFIVQCPPQLGAAQLPALTALLTGLPRSVQYAVEVRHLDFFAKGPPERQLNRLLQQLQMERVCFDTRAFYATLAQQRQQLPAAQRACVEQAARYKPQVPVRPIALTSKPVVRFIGSSLIEHSDAYLDDWVGQLRKWQQQGRRPYFFVYMPCVEDSPQLADRLLRKLGYAAMGSADQAQFELL